MSIGSLSAAISEWAGEDARMLRFSTRTDWPKLVNVKDEEGRTRLENPSDCVRLEIEAALKRDSQANEGPLHQVTLAAFFMSGSADHQG